MMVNRVRIILIFLLIITLACNALVPQSISTPDIGPSNMTDDVGATSTLPPTATETAPPTATNTAEVAPTPLPVPTIAPATAPEMNGLGLRPYWPYSQLTIGEHMLLINLYSGNLLLTHLDQYIPSRGLDNIITRSYNSLDSSQADFGFGWTIDVGNNVRLDLSNTDRILFRDEFGGVNAFYRDGEDFSSASGMRASLQHLDDGYVVIAVLEGIEYHFDSSGDLLAISNKNGNTQGYMRDSDGRVTQIVDTVGRQTNITYGDAGMVTQVTDPAGRVSSYDYHSENLYLANYTDPAGNVVRYGYDPQGLLTQLTDGRGNLWEIEYDANRRVTTITDPFLYTTQFTYEGDRTIITDANGAQSTVMYDSFGTPLAWTNANGLTELWQWDEFFNPVAVTSPLGNTYSMSWQGNSGLMTSATDPLGNTVAWKYDTNYNLTGFTDARGFQTLYTYDVEGANLTSILEANGALTTFEYDQDGNLIRLWDPGANARVIFNPTGKAFRYAYDEQGNLIQAINPLDQQWSFSWIPNTGRLLTQIDPTGNTTQFEYDVLDRLKGITYHDDTQVRFVYDASGNLVEMNDAIGSWAFTYDALDQLVSETDPRIPGEVTYDYDPVGNLQRVIRLDGSELTFQYDLGGRLVAQSNPYDTNGLIEYEYDEENNLIQATYPNGDYTVYAYHSNGWLASLDTGSNEGDEYMSYSFPGLDEGGYDENGNPLLIHRTITLFDNREQTYQSTETLRMAYDEVNQLVQQNYYDENDDWKWGVTVSYTTNGLWRERNWQESGTPDSVWAYTYNAASQWTGLTYSDGGYAALENDASGRLVEMQEVVQVENDGESETINAITNFAYDAAGRVSSIVDPSGHTFLYSYDGLDRLVKVDRLGASEPQEQFHDMLGLAFERKGNTVTNFVNDLAGAVRAVAQTDAPSFYIHRDPRGLITHISDELAATADYCYQGNIISSGSAPRSGLYMPLWNAGLYTTELSGSAQGSSVFHLSSGAAWMHNAQVDTNNLPAATSMRNANTSPQASNTLFARSRFGVFRAIGRWFRSLFGGNDPGGPGRPGLYQRFKNWLHQGKVRRGFLRLIQVLDIIRHLQGQPDSGAQFPDQIRQQIKPKHTITQVWDPPDHFEGLDFIVFPHR